MGNRKVFLSNRFFAVLISISLAISLISTNGLPILGNSSRGIANGVYAAEGDYVYQNDFLDYIVTVEGGKEGDVSGSDCLIISTEKKVTVRMKDGIEKTDQPIICYIRGKISSINLVLDNVYIDKSGSDTWFASYDYEDTFMPKLCGIYCERGHSISGNSTVSTDSGNIHITLKGKNTIIGPSTSPESGGYVWDNSVSEYVQYTGKHSTYGIYGVNISISGEGSLETSSRDYGIYALGGLKINSGSIKCEGTAAPVYRKYDKGVYGGSFPLEAFGRNTSGKDTVYGLTAPEDTYIDPVSGNTIKAYEINPFGDGDYPVSVVHSSEAEEYLSGLYGRTALSKMLRGKEYVQAYDSALGDAFRFSGGSSFSMNYGADYGFTTSYPGGTTVGESNMIYNAIYNDHPGFFWWWAEAVSPGKGGATVNLANGLSASVYKTRLKEFEDAAQECLYEAAITDEMTEADKAYSLYRVLIKKVTYDINYIDQTAYAAMVDNTAVCAGYAKAYAYLLQKAGIQASYVGGEAIAGQEAGGHAWVLAKIAGKYYYFDPTLDDGGNVPNFKFYMISGTTLLKDHTILAEDGGYDYPIADTGDDGTVPSDTVTLSVSGDEHANAYPSGAVLRKGSRAAITVLTDEGYSPVIKSGDEEIECKKVADGKYVAVVSVYKDMTVNVITDMRIDTELSLSLVGADEDSSGISILEGKEFSIKAQLKCKPESMALPETASVILSIFDSSDQSVISKTVKVDSTGQALYKISAEDIAKLISGTYKITASYSGNEIYSSSEADSIILKVKKQISYDFTKSGFKVSPTKGGELDEGAVTYDEEEDTLLISTNKAITISMASGVESSSSRIEIKKGLSSAEITFNNVTIDRSGVTAKNSAETAAVYSASRLNTSGDESEMNQTATKLTMHLFGENTFIGASKFDADNFTMQTERSEYSSEYRAVSYGIRVGGTLDIDGTGSLVVKGGLSGLGTAMTDSSGNPIVSFYNTSYGIYAESISVTDASVNVYAGSAGSVLAVGRDTTNATLTLDNGTLTVEAADGLGGFSESCGLRFNQIKIDNGSNLNVKAGKVSDSFPEYSKGIDGWTLQVFDGVLDVSAYGIGFKGYGYNTLFYGGYVNLDAATPMKVSGETQISIQGGYFAEGNPADGTVYGLAVGSNLTVKETVKDGKKWYEIIDSYPLTVKGGKAGVDYEWADYFGLTKLTIKSDRSLILSDNPNASEGSVCFIESEYQLPNVNITFDGVNIDRSAFISTTKPSSTGNSQDAILNAFSSDVHLTIKGENSIRAARPDNISVYGIHSKNLTIDGDGTLTMLGTDSDSSQESTLLYSYNDMTVDGPAIIGKVGSNASTVSHYNANKVIDAKNFTFKRGSIKAEAVDSLVEERMVEPIFIHENVSVEGGSLEVLGAKSKAYPSYGMNVYGDMTVSGGKITIKNVSSEKHTAAGIRMDGTYTQTAGEVEIITGDGGYGETNDKVTSSGINAKGNVVIKGGRFIVTGGSSDSGIRAGIYSWSDFIMTDGEVNVSAGNVKTNSVDIVNRDISIGILATNSIEISGGTLTVYGGKARDGSYGIQQCGSNGKFNIKGGNIKSYAKSAKGSYAVSFFGYGNLSGGNLVAEGGEAETNSIGIADTGMELKISGTNITASGKSVSGTKTSEKDTNMNVGLYVGESSQFTGGDVVISGGNLNLSGGKSGDSYGLYVHKKLTITGGVFICSGNTADIDADVYSISGGSFAKGDVSAGKVYGISVLQGYIVKSEESSEYGFIVQKAGTEEDKTDGNKPDNKPGNTTDNTDKKTDNKTDNQNDGDKSGKGKADEKTDGKKTDTASVPAKGTKENSKDGTAVYTVTGSTRSGGKTVATVTYTAPNGKAKTAAKVTVPSKVTLADGSTAVVTKIAPKAFAADKKVKTVVIPSTVTNIGKNAFSKCTNLRKVTVKGNNLEIIDANAFRGCTNLTSVVISAKVKSIGSKAFFGCKNLKTVTFKGKNIKKIGSGAFKGTNKDIVFKVPAAKKKDYKKMIAKAGAPKTAKYK